MDYRSTKETARRWGISANRVVFLAKQGRIPGARLVGKSWMIPYNAEKPADKRFNEIKKLEEQTPSEDFFFPLFPFRKVTDYELEHVLTEEWRCLCTAQMSLAHGNFTEVYPEFDRILKTTKNRYIRIGAIYCQCLCSLALADSFRFYMLIHELQAIFAEDFPHKKELEPIYHDLEAYYLGNEYFINTFTLGPFFQYPKSEHVYLQVLSAYSAFVKKTTLGGSLDFGPYELACQSAENEEIYTAAVMLHMYLALMYKVESRIPECHK